MDDISGGRVSRQLPERFNVVTFDRKPMLPGRV